MDIEIKVPPLPESVSNAKVLKWNKKVGEEIDQDEPVVDLETDKVVLEVPCPIYGTIKSIKKIAGTTVNENEILGIISIAKNAKEQKDEYSDYEIVNTLSEHEDEELVSKGGNLLKSLSPSIRQLLNVHEIDPSKVKGTGKKGKILKNDLREFLSGKDYEDSEIKDRFGSISVGYKNLYSNISNENNHDKKINNTDTMDSSKKDITNKDIKDRNIMNQSTSTDTREVYRVPMSKLRETVSLRLLEAKRNTAMLTTFNEVNLDEVISLRNRYKDSFEKKHNVKLGFMSFFTKAVVEALKSYPSINASVEGNEIIYKKFYDIGIAVSTERGLVVPVLKNVENMSMSTIEQNIVDYADKARKNKLSLENIQGGTFTITNGGVFGSLLSTPIINPPQSGILGMHKIEKRPIVKGNDIVISSMMYMALSYDHRIIDGRESVGFLVKIKELLEDPSRILLEI